MDVQGTATNIDGDSYQQESISVRRKFIFANERVLYRHISSHGQFKERAKRPVLRSILCDVLATLLTVYRRTSSTAPVDVERCDSEASKVATSELWPAASHTRRRSSVDCWSPSVRCHSPVSGAMDHRRLETAGHLKWQAQPSTVGNIDVEGTRRYSIVTRSQHSAVRVAVAVSRSHRRWAMAYGDA